MMKKEKLEMKQLAMRNKVPKERSGQPKLTALALELIQAEKLLKEARKPRDIELQEEAERQKKALQKVTAKLYKRFERKRNGN